MISNIEKELLRTIREYFLDWDKLKQIDENFKSRLLLNLLAMYVAISGLWDEDVNQTIYLQKYEDKYIW